MGVEVHQWRVIYQGQTDWTSTQPLVGMIRRLKVMKEAMLAVSLPLPSSVPEKKVNTFYCRISILTSTSKNFLLYFAFNFGNMVSA
jgi:hypothetical protein